jgi:seryl-tRNA synthetase
MTRDQAFKKIRKLLGPKAAADVRGDISSPEKRERASESLKFLRTRREELDAKITARQKELLDVPDFQALLEERRKLRKEVDSFQGEALHYKFMAGRISGVGGISFFHVEAQGDTWEEVIAKLEAKAAKK